MKTQTAMQTKERPILFSTPMVKAILENRKTQTRRVIQTFEGEEFCDLNAYGNAVFTADQKKYREVKNKYGLKGDKLYVRETWADNFSTHVSHNGLLYKATALTDTRANGLHWATLKDGQWFDYYDRPIKWKPSIHMPRWASRITLEITNIRVERLQDISYEDAEAEGVTHPDETFENDIFELGSMRARFRYLWDSINASRGYSWESNPFVWVIEFQKI